MTWCEYTCKCKEAINQRQRIIDCYINKDNNAEAEKISYQSKCEKNYFNCPDRQKFKEAKD